MSQEQTPTPACEGSPPDKKDDAWRSAALRLGEQLAPTGPNWYYAMTPTQWLEWCQSALPSAVAHSDCPDCGGTGSTPISTCLRCGGTGSLQSAIGRTLIDDVNELRTLYQGGKMLAALEESVKLQSHYAELLNTLDGGQRMTFTAESWLARLAELNATDRTTP